MADKQEKRERNDPRSLQIAARKKRMQEINQPLPRVRVTAASDEMRRALKHPSGIKFPEGGGSVEWPFDQFTRRRIKEGAVHTELAEPEKGHRKRPTPPAEPPPA